MNYQGKRFDDRECIQKAVVLLVVILHKKIGIKVSDAVVKTKYSQVSEGILSKLKLNADTIKTGLSPTLTTLAHLLNFDIKIIPHVFHGYPAQITGYGKHLDSI